MKLAGTKKQMADKTWLEYFNQTLYEKNIITESERNRLALQIDYYKPAAKGKTAAQGRIK